MLPPEELSIGRTALSVNHSSTAYRVKIDFFFEKWKRETFRGGQDGNLVEFITTSKESGHNLKWDSEIIQDDREKPFYSLRDLCSLQYLNIATEERIYNLEGIFELIARDSLTVRVGFESRILTIGCRHPLGNRKDIMGKNNFHKLAAAGFYLFSLSWMHMKQHSQHTASTLNDTRIFDPFSGAEERSETDNGPAIF